MFRKFLALTLLLCSLSFAQAPAAAPANIITPGDNLIVDGVPAISVELQQKVARYTESRGAGFSSWHPTKKEMLISTRFADTAQVHTLKMPMGARTQLTFFPDRVGGSSYQPKQGKYFIFSKDVSGGEWFQIFRFDIATGESTMLTDGKSRNVRVVWNHSGDRISYGSTRRNRQDIDLYVMDPADPKSDKMLLELKGGGFGATDWSHDGKQLILTEYLSAQESYLYLVDVATGEKKLITPRAEKGKETVSYGGGVFALSDKHIYTTTDRESEFQRLTHIDLTTGKHTYLTTSIPWDVDSFDLSNDGKRIAFVTNENGMSKLYLLNTATGNFQPAGKLPPGLIGGVEWHDNNRDIGFSMSSARTTGDVYSLDANTGVVTRWTESELGGINPATLSDAELIKWKSYDGKEISGFLYKPAAKFTGKRPVIVNIHGGPEGQSRPGFIGRSNYYLNELGVAIIYPNVRGSAGFGKTFLAADNGFNREGSYKDIDTLLDWIKADPRFDGDKIMVTGGSYGGFMTLAVAANYSDKICCSLDVVGISNFTTFLQNTEAYRRDLRRAEYGDERDPKMREFFEKIAPLNKADQIKKPMFVVQGKNDPRVPISEADQIVATLKKTNTPVWYLVGKDEGHGFAKKKNQDFQFYATVMFIEKYLLGK